MFKGRISLTVSEKIMVQLSRTPECHLYTYNDPASFSCRLRAQKHKCSRVTVQSNGFKDQGYLKWQDIFFFFAFTQTYMNTNSSARDIKHQYVNIKCTFKD